MPLYGNTVSPCSTMPSFSASPLAQSQGHVISTATAVVASLAHTVAIVGGASQCDDAHPARERRLALFSPSLLLLSHSVGRQHASIVRRLLPTRACVRQQQQLRAVSSAVVPTVQRQSSVRQLVRSSVVAVSELPGHSSHRRHVPPCAYACTCLLMHVLAHASIGACARDDDTGWLCWVSDCLCWTIPAGLFVPGLCVWLQTACCLPGGPAPRRVPRPWARGVLRPCSVEYAATECQPKSRVHCRVATSPPSLWANSTWR